MATGFHFMSSGNGQGDVLQDCPGNGSVAVASASLSDSHICTPDRDDSVLLSSWRDDREAGAFTASFYDGGSLVEVKEAKQGDASGLKRASALRGALRTTVHPGYRVKDGQDQDQDAAGPRRGKVTKFSDKSRRRLHVLLGKVDAAAPVLFLTLTISDQVERDGKTLKEALRRFKLRLTRRFPAVGMVWRMECVRRKSGARVGQAVAHIHALLWGMVEAPGLREWVGEAWSGSVGDQCRTRIETPRSSKRTQSYMCKLYMSKDGDDGDVIPDVGRFWGVLADDHIPWASVIVRRLAYGEAVKLLRVFRRWIVAGRRSRGKRGKVPYLTQWRSFFVSDPSWWADRLGGIIGIEDDPVALLSGIGRAVEVKAL